LVKQLLTSPATRQMREDHNFSLQGSERLQIKANWKSTPKDSPNTSWGDTSNLKLRTSGGPKRLQEDLESSIFTKRRQYGRLFGFDTSKSKLGRKLTKNWIDHSLEKKKQQVSLEKLLPN